MSLTPDQIIAIRPIVLANTDADIVAARTARNDTELARLLNLDSAFVVWKPNTKKSDIFGALSWKSFTPVDAPDGTVLWTNRALACQGQQFNIQTMIISPGDTLDMSQASIRTGIKDAVQNLPSGVAGALLDAGWAPIKTVSNRFAKRAEAMLATGTGTNGTPGFLTFAGTIDINDISLILN
jgi:hypothetical protein